MCIARHDARHTAIIAPFVVSVHESNDLLMRWGFTPAAGGWTFAHTSLYHQARAVSTHDTLSEANDRVGNRIKVAAVPILILILVLFLSLIKTAVK